MNAEFYFVAVDEDGIIIDKFDEKCDCIEFKDYGILFKSCIDNFRYEFLGFYTYDSIAGFKRKERKVGVKFDS